MTGQTDARCAGHDLDFTEIREYDMGPDGPASTAQDVDRARATCATCPLLVACRRYALTETDVAGMAGGMTEVERETWRHRNRVHVVPVSIVDVTPGRDITPDVADALPETDGGIPDVVVQLVLRMTREGIPAEEIVARLDRPDVTHRTVKYLRHRYSKGPTRVDA